MQISRAILGQDQKLRLPKFLEEEEKSPEATKQVGVGLSGMSSTPCNPQVVKCCAIASDSKQVYSPWSLLGSCKQIL